MDNPSSTTHIELHQAPKYQMISYTLDSSKVLVQDRKEFQLLKLQDLSFLISFLLYLLVSSTTHKDNHPLLLSLDHDCFLRDLNHHSMKACLPN